MRALVTMTLVGLAIATGATAAENDLPLTGARVRVVVPSLGSEWQIGIFNRLRVEPPCYRVILFELAQPRRVRAVLSVREISRLEVSRVYDGRTRVTPNEPTDRAEREDEWRNVSLDALRAAEQHCRIRDDREG